MILEEVPGQKKIRKMPVSWREPGTWHDKCQIENCVCKMSTKENA